MDLTEEDLSARVLLRKVLHTEQPRSPVTRSANSVRRSARMKHAAGLESPGSALRHRLKKKLHESAAASPLPLPKRMRSSVVKQDPPNMAPSTLDDEDLTTRGLLRGIIHMETETSLLMSGQPALQESEPNPETSVSSAGERTEGLSGAELSDLTLHTEPLTHVVRGLSRKKQQRVFSVSALEKQFDQLTDNTEDVSRVSERGDVFQEKPDTSQDSDFSAGSKSGLNLTLKTPFVERRSERAVLQRKVSNRRLQSVEAFDEAVQRCLEQGPNQEQSVSLAGKTLDDSSWQKFTLGLNDVTELYVQMKKDDTVEPSAEIDNDEQAETEKDEQYHVSEIPNDRDSKILIQDEKEHEMESLLLDDEEVVPSSQESPRDEVFLNTEYDIILAPTQAMTESLPESQNAELEGQLSGENDVVVEEIAHEEIVEDVEHENVVEIEAEEVEYSEENSDGLNYPERITRRAHRSEGAGAVLAIPGTTTRVTKSFGAGLNPREKDLLDLIDGDRESVENILDEERQALVSPTSPQFHHEEVIITSEQRSTQNEASLNEDDLPQFTENEDVNQSEEKREELIDSEPANQPPEPAEELIESQSANQSTEADEEKELIDSEPTNQSTKPEDDEEEEELMDSEPTNQSTKPDDDEDEEELMDSEPTNQSTKPDDDEEEEELIDSEPTNQSTEPPQDGEDMMESELANQSLQPAKDKEEMLESEPANLTSEAAVEEEEDIIDSEPANQSYEFAQEEEEEEDVDEDDARSAELSIKTPAFVKQKRVFASPSAQTTLTVLKEVNAGAGPQVSRRAPRQKRQTGTDVLPKSYVMSIFKHFAKTKVASDVYPVINEILKKYFDRLADDLETYATHAKRKTIEVEDFELLMRRQGFVTDSMPVNVLIEKYLPLEYRKLLIPVATSGNKVIPTQRR
uniref:Centromere protein T n=1 Tax=Danio rerio TaxID=7955 RepID=E9QIT3_DANRE|nr:centromere protein T isoform X2 [Danio rerio]|eukprot:XP_005161062.1 centromere protein T isoform X2 [Danio rerio]